MGWFLVFSFLGIFLCIFTKIFAFSLKILFVLTSIIFSVGLIIALITSSIILFLPAFLLVLLGIGIGKMIK